MKSNKQVTVIIILLSAIYFMVKTPCIVKADEIDISSPSTSEEVILSTDNNGSTTDILDDSANSIDSLTIQLDNALELVSKYKGIIEDSLMETLFSIIKDIAIIVGAVALMFKRFKKTGDDLRQGKISVDEANEQLKTAKSELEETVKSEQMNIRSQIETLDSLVNNTMNDLSNEVMSSNSFIKEATEKLNVVIPKLDLVDKYDKVIKALAETNPNLVSNGVAKKLIEIMNGSDTNEQ